MIITEGESDKWTPLLSHLDYDGRTVRKHGSERLELDNHLEPITLGCTKRDM